MTENDRIPIIGWRRGVGLHDQQSPARLEEVRRDIDRVFALADVAELYRFAADCANSPESRLFAAAKTEALWQLASEDRKIRPSGITLERVRAIVAGLDTLTWRSPTHFASDLDVQLPGRPGPVPRDVP